MIRKRHEIGEGQMGCLVGLVVLAFAALLAFKLIPVKVKIAEVRGTMDNESKMGSQHDDGRIKYAILQKAHDEGLAMTEDNITIKRLGSNIYIDIDYVIPVQFPGYLYKWHVQNHVENPLF